MEFSEAQRASILDEAYSLVIVKRPPKSFAYHMNRYAQYLTQIEIDKEDLILSSFDWENTQQFYAIQTMINEIHAQSIAVEVKQSKADNQHHELLTNMIYYRKILMIVLRHINKQSCDIAIEATLCKIKKGNTHCDTIRDILLLCEIIGEHIELASGITPQGILVDEEYLARVSSKAEEALTLMGEPLLDMSDRARLVDLQSRLLMLSMEAIDYIKEYAEAAFFTNMNYFHQHYTYCSTERSTFDEEYDELNLSEELHHELSINALV